MELRQQIVIDQITRINKKLKLGNNDKAFQIFTHCIYSDVGIHSYDPNDDVDGGQDKQIDNITIDSKDGEGTIYITQSKNEESFSSNSIIKIRNGLNWIFKKKREEVATLSNKKFKDKITQCRDLYSDIGPANIHVKVSYISLGSTEKIADECNQEIKTILEEYDNDTFASFKFDLIGADEIVDRINSIEKKNKKIKASIKIKYDTNKPSLIKYHSHGYKGIICTVKAEEIARIVNEEGKGFVFDLNVRKYLGNLGNVNKDIKETCSDEETSFLFWFLNNGITIVCDKVDSVEDPDNPHMKIENLQIVNGCQTSSSLAIAAKEGILQPDTNVILKIFETNKLDLVDKIVLTSNNQNKITNRNLRANDKIQRDLEKALLIYGYHYERKPRQYKNQDVDKIIPNELCATAFLASVLKRPSDARSRKYKIWNDYYKTIFNSTYIEKFIIAFLIKSYTTTNINNSIFISDDDELVRYIVKNGQFHIARITAFLWRKGDNWDDTDLLKVQLKELEESDEALDAYISKAIEILFEILNEDLKLKFDINNTFKSSAFDKIIDKKLYKEYSA